LTYRLSDHTTADDSGRYRNPDEVRQAWALEPLIRVREYLTKAGALSAADEQAWGAAMAPARSIRRSPII